MSTQTVTFNPWPLCILWAAVFGTLAVVFKSTTLMWLALLPFFGMFIILGMMLLFMFAALIGMFFAWWHGAPIEFKRGDVTKTYQRRNLRG